MPPCYLLYLLCGIEDAAPKSGTDRLNAGLGRINSNHPHTVCKTTPEGLARDLRPVRTHGGCYSSERPQRGQSKSRDSVAP